MAKLTKPVNENFTHDEIMELAGNLPLSSSSCSLIDNGDGTHTYTVAELEPEGLDDDQGHA